MCGHIIQKHIQQLHWLKPNILHEIERNNDLYPNSHTKYIALNCSLSLQSFVFLCSVLDSADSKLCSASGQVKSMPMSPWEFAGIHQQCISFVVGCFPDFFCLAVWQLHVSVWLGIFWLFSTTSIPGKIKIFQTNHSCSILEISRVSPQDIHTFSWCGFLFSRCNWAKG